MHQKGTSIFHNNFRRHRPAHAAQIQHLVGAARAHRAAEYLLVVEIGDVGEFDLFKSVVLEQLVVVKLPNFLEKGIKSFGCAFLPKLPVSLKRVHSIYQYDLKKQLGDPLIDGVPIRRTFVYAYSQDVPCNDPNKRSPPQNRKASAAE